MTTRNKMTQLLVVLVASALASACYAVLSSPKDICIVGGGTAGAYLALRAADHGKTVAVLEASTRLGGHCSTFKASAGFGKERPISTGVRILSGDVTDLIRRVHERFGLPLLDISNGGLGLPVAQKLYDFKRGFDLSFLPQPSPALLRRAVDRFTHIFYAKYAFLETNVTHPDFTAKSSIDVEELLAPFSEFVKAHSLHLLSPYFDAVLTQGYGNQENVPTYYALRTLTPRILPILIPSISPADVGLRDSFYVPLESCGKVFERIEEALQSHNALIEFEAEVEHVARPDETGESAVWYNVPNVGRRMVACRSTVIAIPQEAEKLADIMDLRPAERSVFERVNHYNSYYTSVWRAEGPLVDTRTRLPIAVHNLDLREAPKMSPRLPATLNFRLEAFDSERNKSYVNPLRAYWGKFDGSDEEVQSAVRKELGRMEKLLGRAAGRKIKFEPTPLFFEQHKYLLRPGNIDDVRNGLYNRMYDLQGTAGTFYTGALFARENQMLIWKYCEELLERKILPFLNEKPGPVQEQRNLPAIELPSSVSLMDSRQLGLAEVTS